MFRNFSHGCAYALIAFVGLGCAPTSTPAVWTNGPTLFVTPELQRELPEVAQALVVAAHTWCEAGYACVRVLPGHGANEARIADRYSDIGEPDPYVVAVTHIRATGTVIWFFRKFGENARTIRWSEVNCDTELLIESPSWVATHELGHFIDVSHSADRRSVMYPQTACDYTFTP